VTRQRAGYSADPVTVRGFIRSCPIWHGDLFCSSERQR